MARPLRINYANAWYHVMNRGAGRKKIFQNNFHRMIFLELLEECHRMYNIHIHAYCLMDNHYHLLVLTPDANLSRAMRHLNGVYTQRYNRLTKSDGSLFRGRYKAKIIEEDCYLLIVSRYIHLNPVDANIVTKPDHYRWSSYSAYIGTAKSPSWLSTTTLQCMFSKTVSLSHIKNYEDYVENHDMKEINVFTSTKLASPILGSAEFKEKIISTVESSIENACAADLNRARTVPDFDLIASQVCDFYHIKMDSLYITKRGNLNWPRLVFIYVSRKRFGLTYMAISQFLGCTHRSTISACIQKCHSRLVNQPILENEITIIYQSIKKMIK